MTLTPIFDPDKHQRPMRVAALMSGSGTNIMRLLEHEKTLGHRMVGLLLRPFLFSAIAPMVFLPEKRLLSKTACHISAMISGFFMSKTLSGERLQTRKALRQDGPMTGWLRRW